MTLNPIELSEPIVSFTHGKVIRPTGSFTRITHGLRPCSLRCIVDMSSVTPPE